MSEMLRLHLLPPLASHLARSVWAVPTQAEATLKVHLQAPVGHPVRIGSD